MMERYTQQAQEALGPVVGVAESLDHGYVGAEHLLIGLPQEGTGAATRVLEDDEMEEDWVIELASQLITPSPATQTTNQIAYTLRARRIIENSYREAVRFKTAQIGTGHILIAVLREGDCVASRLLNAIGVSIQKLYIDLLAAMGEDAPAVKNDISGTKGGRKNNATSTLDNYSRDLAQLTMDGRLDPAIGREQEIQRVIQTPSRGTKSNPYLIGESGVGKTAVVERLTQMITSDNVPETIADKRVTTLDLSSMVAGSKYRGKFEERIKKVISEVIDSGDVLLFIGEIHTIIGAGGVKSSLDTSNILKPSLARGEPRSIGATTTNEYHKYIERDSVLKHRFQPVTVGEPAEDKPVAILRGFRSRYEEHHKAEITDEALAVAVKLSSHCISDRSLSDKAIDLIGEAPSRVRLTNYTKPSEIKEYEEEIEALGESEEEAIKKEAYEKVRETKSKQEKLCKKINQTMEK